MKTQYILSLVFLLYVFSASAQNKGVLITEKSTNVIKPDASAALHVEHNKKGFLMPRVALTSNTDQVTVPTPVDGVTVYNTNSGKFNYWYNNQWNTAFEAEDAIKILPVTQNFVASSSSTVVSSSFPTSAMPLFNEGDNATGWIDLGVSKTITVTNAVNSNFFLTEGMAQITYDSDKFQFAIGIFIDGKLAIVRKFYNSTTGGCIWKKFNLSGVFKNLSVGTHTVKVYAYNLPVPSGSSYTSISYGGPNPNPRNGRTSSGYCENINETVAKIFFEV